MMTEKAARRLAVAEMKKALHRLAVDANLADHYGATYREAVSASRQSVKLREAIAVLSKPQETKNAKP